MFVYLLSKVCFMFGGLENLILHPAAHSKLHLLQTNKIHTSKSNSASWSCGTITQPVYTFTASHRMHLPRQRKFGGFWRSQSVLTEAKVNSPAALKLWWVHLLKHSQKSKENDLYQTLYHLITANCIY